MTLPARVTPKGGRDAFLPFENGDEWVRVKVAAPPEDGKANTAVIALFAKRLGLPKSAVQIVSGDTSRLKRLQLTTNNPQALLDTLAGLLGGTRERCFRE